MEFKVSVIVPVYNAEKYLCECVDSLLRQTLDSVEIILIEDGSPDGSGAICDRYAQQYNNIVVYHVENGGPSKARNIGLGYAHGKYIGFVDSDDYVKSDMFEILYSKAEEKNIDIMMCSYSTDDGKMLKPSNMEYGTLYDGKDEIINGLISCYSTSYHIGLYSVWNKIFNSNLLRRNNIFFDEELIRAEDAWFVFECLKVSYTIGFVNTALYIYRQVPTSTMHTVQADRYERSKAFRLKLLDEDKVLGIVVDKNEFFCEFLYEAIIYCRAMMQQNNSEEVRSVLDDGFFYDSCKYTKYLPIHAKILCRLERMRLKHFMTILLKYWSRRR